MTAPGQRYHPAIAAQAAATLTEMFPGRLWVALGTGEEDSTPAFDRLDQALTNGIEESRRELRSDIVNARAVLSGSTVGAVMLSVVAALVVHQILELDPAVGTDASEGDRPALQQGHQEGPRDAEEFGGLLGGQFGVVGDDSDRAAVGDHVEDPPE